MKVKIKYFLFSVPYDSKVCSSNDNDKAFGDYSLWIHEVIDSGGLQSPVSGQGLLGSRPQAGGCREQASDGTYGALHRLPAAEPVPGAGKPGDHCCKPTTG